MTVIKVFVVIPKYISTHTLTWSVTFCVLDSLLAIIISTHTLTWSVTPYLLNLNEDKHISTHTLTWSVTLAKLS